MTLANKRIQYEKNSRYEDPTCSSTSRRNHNKSDSSKIGISLLSSSKNRKTNNSLSMCRSHNIDLSYVKEEKLHHRTEVIDLQEQEDDLSQNSDISDISIDTKISFGDKTKASIKKVVDEKEQDEKINLAINRKLKMIQYAKEAVKKDREKRKKRIDKKSSNSQTKGISFSRENLKDFAESFFTSFMEEKMKEQMMNSSSTASKKHFSPKKEKRNVPTHSHLSQKTMLFNNDNNMDNGNLSYANNSTYDNNRDYNMSSMNYTHEDTSYSFGHSSRMQPSHPNWYGSRKSYQKPSSFPNWYGPSKSSPNEYKRTFGSKSKYSYFNDNSVPIEYWGVIDLHYPQRWCKKNKTFMKSQLRKDVGPRFIKIGPKEDDKVFNWPRYHGLLHYSFMLIKEWNGELGKRQIAKYLLDIVPTFESFLDSKGYSRSMLLSQIKTHLKRKKFCIPYKLREKPGEYYNHTRSEPPTANELEEDDSVSSDLTPSLCRFIDKYKNSFDYMNVEPPPDGLEYIPPLEDTNDLSGTIISVHSETSRPASFNETEGFTHIPNENGKSGISSINREIKKGKNPNIVITIIKPSFQWTEYDISISEDTLKQYFNPDIPLSLKNEGYGDEDYRHYIFDDFWSDDEYNDLTNNVSPLNEATYVKAYAKTLKHFVTNLTKLHDPIDDLRDKDIKQDAIDLAYQCARENFKNDYDMARTFLTNVYHLIPFEYGLLRFIQCEDDTVRDTAVCYCPCNGNFKKWRQAISCDDNTFLDAKNVCINTRYTPQDMINHLASYRKDCKVHRLLYLYCFYLYDGEQDRANVSDSFSFTLRNRFNFNMVKRYVS